MISATHSHPGRADRAPTLLVLALLCSLGAPRGVALAQTPPPAQPADRAGWPTWGGPPGGTRYSKATQVDRTNVSRLKVAWIRRTGDITQVEGSPSGRRPTAFEATPILLDSLLYLATPRGRVVALNAESGTLQWFHDIKIDEKGSYGDWTNRGVAAWRDTTARSGRCSRRIFVTPIDARLVALDADSGKTCPGFGEDGKVDLVKGLTYQPKYKGEYETTSPPTVVGDAVIVGSAVADNGRWNAPNGVVRAFDARTGKQLWKWDPVPMGAGAPGAANAWAPFSADLARGLVFVPTASPSPDYFGGRRPGNNEWANSVVALNAATGVPVWQFQVVHHDLWDYDVPAQPVLFTLRRDGKEIPAVAVGTKMGHLFILDRETGSPLFPVEERPVPTSDVPGETASATQPFPVLPAPLVPETLSPDDAFGLSDSTRASCRAQITALRSEGMFTPPSEKGTLVIPANIGGLNWSGMAIDEDRQLLIVPTNRLAGWVRLIPRKEYERERKKTGEAANNRVEGLRVGGEFAPMEGTPYGMYREFLFAADKVPCNPPPWGALTAIDLATGKVKWEVPIGTLPWLLNNPEAEKWGSPILGGPIVTAGGLIIMAGTMDGKIRVLNVETGEVLREATLPAGGNAVPMTYRLGKTGRQFLVIAAGGHGKFGTVPGDYVIAFALN